MSNTNLTVDWIGNEALALAHEKLNFIGTINREFDSSFKPGYGSTIRIRVPSQYTVTNGRVIDVQDGVQQSTSISVATQTHVAMRYNSQEYAQDLVNFRRLHLEPAMATLAAIVEGRVIEGCTQAVANLVGVTTFPVTSLFYISQARGRLNQYLAPKSNRNLLIDSMTMASMVNSFSNFTNPAREIGEQYREGMVARTGMADIYENEKVWAMANAATSSAARLGDSSGGYVITDPDDSITVSNNFFVPANGQVFTINGVFACHPETKEPYTHLQQFSIQSGSTASSLVISPVIRLTGARKNVCQANGDDLPAAATSTATISWAGTGTSTYIQPLMYQKDAFTFATAALPMMGGSESCTVKTFDGISLRVWEDTDIRNDEKITRIDILYGFAALRPQWACRIIGTGQ